MRFIPSTEGPQVATRRGYTLAEIAAQRAEQHEASAAERVAEHTGHPEYEIADRIADALTTDARRFTTADRLLIVNELTR